MLNLNWMYKLILGIALLLGIALGCYWSGYSHERAKLIAFQAQVTQEATDQKNLTILKEASNAGISMQNKITYDDNLAKLSHDLDQSKRVQLASSSPYSLRSSTGSAARTDVTVKEPSGTCESTKFYSDSLEDALQLEALQSWITEEKLDGTN